MVRNNIFKILEKLKDRLWIPYQVGKEFFDNKNKVMVNSYNEYDTLNTALRKKIQEANYFLSFYIGRIKIWLRKKQLKNLKNKANKKQRKR